MRLIAKGTRDGDQGVRSDLDHNPVPTWKPIPLRLALAADIEVQSPGEKTQKKLDP